MTTLLVWATAVAGATIAYEEAAAAGRPENTAQAWAAAATVAALVALVAALAYAGALDAGYHYTRTLPTRYA